MAAAFVQEVGQWAVTDGNATFAIPVGATVAAGHTLVVLAQTKIAGPPQITSAIDSKGNTWAAYTPTMTDTFAVSLAYAYMTTGLTTSDTITITWTNTNFAFKWGTVLEFSGVASASLLDATGSKDSTFTGGAVSVPITTVAAGDALAGIIGQQGNTSYTIAGGFTDQSNQVNGGAGQRSDYIWKIGSAAGTEDPAGSLGAAENYAGAIVALKASTGATASGPWFALEKDSERGIMQERQNLFINTG